MTDNTTPYPPKPTDYTINGKQIHVDTARLPVMTLDEAYQIAPPAAMMTPQKFQNQYKDYTPEQIYVAEQMVQQDMTAQHDQARREGRVLSIKSGPGVTAQPGDIIKTVSPVTAPNEATMIASAQTFHERCIMYNYDPSNIAFYTLLGYIAISILIAAAVGRYLFRNGQVFLSKLFPDNDMAIATNRLLLTGFYLVNIGYILLTVNAPDDQFRAMHSSAMWLQFLATKIGLVVVVLGAMHFFNMGVLWFLSANKRNCTETRTAS